MLRKKDIDVKFGIHPVAGARRRRGFTMGWVALRRR
jgi:NAD/NADP transhydrogenase beta subunit